MLDLEVKIWKAGCMNRLGLNYSTDSDLLEMHYGKLKYGGFDWWLCKAVLLDS